MPRYRYVNRLYLRWRFHDWENPRDSIGREIGTSRSGSDTAWFATGPASEAFEKRIIPGLDPLLKSNAVEEEEIYLRIYMIGPNQNKARPVIMVCCQNRAVGDQIKKEIASNDVMKDFPAIRVQYAAKPLEQIHIQAEPLTFHGGCPSDSSPDKLELEMEEDPDTVVFASASEPLLGRRLFARDKSTTNDPEDQSYSRMATGGAVLLVGNEVVQLTAGHIVVSPYSAATASSLPASADTDGWELETWEMMDGAKDSDSEMESEEEDLGISAFARRSQIGEVHRRRPRRGVEHKHGGDLHNSGFCFDNTGAGAPPDAPPSCIPEDAVPAGPLMLSSRAAGVLDLDYNLVRLAMISSLGHDLDNANSISISLGNGCTPQKLLITHALDAEGELEQEKEVTVVTATSGPISGTLIPGKTFYSKAGRTSFQEQLVIQLRSPVYQGDSGSSVIDTETGGLYGHITVGCPGTGTAYLVPATHVIRDIELRSGASVCFPSQVPAYDTRRFREQLAEFEISHTSDIWSLGCTVSEALIWASMAPKQEGHLRESALHLTSPVDKVDHTGTTPPGHTLASVAKESHEQTVQQPVLLPIQVGATNNKANPGYSSPVIQASNGLHTDIAPSNILVDMGVLSDSPCMTKGDGSDEQTDVWFIDKHKRIDSIPFASRPYRCPYAGCAGGFNRKADLQRHRTYFHRDNTKDVSSYGYILHSGYDACSRPPFMRRDHFRDHLRNFHKGDLQTPSPSLVHNGTLQLPNFKVATNHCSERAYQRPGIWYCCYCGNPHEPPWTNNTSRRHGEGEGGQEGHGVIPQLDYADDLPPAA